jgi:hypothetical protein
MKNYWESLSQFWFIDISHILASSQRRAMWYTMVTTTKEEETQQKGWVMVVYNIGKQGGTARLLVVKQSHSMRWSIPHRLLGLHYCYEDKSVRLYVSTIRFLMDKHAKIHFTFSTTLWGRRKRFLSVADLWNIRQRRFTSARR